MLSFRLWRRPGVPLAIGLIVASPALGGGIRGDDIACEHAVVVLSDCCPEIEPSMLDCSYSAGGCGSSEEPPLLDETESDCIRETSCAALLEGGVCRRVVDRQEARSAAREEGEEDAYLGEEAVCP